MNNSLTLGFKNNLQKLISFCLMVDRIRELMNTKDLSPSQFADTIQVPRAVISHILSGRNKPSLDVIFKIISSFPDLDLRWLLLGEQGELKNLAVAEIKNSKTSPCPEDFSIAKDKGKMEGEVGKVQKEEASHAPSAPSQEKPREIERVIFFYTDKSFSEYKPEKRNSA